MVLPALAAGVDAVVDLDVGGFFDVFPEGAAFVHALGGEEEGHALGDAAFEGAAEIFHPGFGALGASGDVVGEEIGVAEPDDLVAAEHGDGEERLDGGGANFESGVGIIRDAVDGFVGEAVIAAAGELVVEGECALADEAFIAADDGEKVSGFAGRIFCFRGHGMVVAGCGGDCKRGKSRGAGRRGSQREISKKSRMTSR